MVWPTVFDKQEEFKFAGLCVPPFQVRAAKANNMLDHLCSLNVGSRAPLTRLSGLICTIGKASREVDTLEDLIESGMNIACLNFSHGNITYHTNVLANIRTALKNFNEKIGMKCPLAIAAITKGPSIRATFPVGSHHSEIILYEDEIIQLSSNEDYVITKNNPKIIHINYNLHNTIKIGCEINIDNRRILLTCIEIHETIVYCKVVQGGSLRSGRRVYLPGVPVDIPPLNDKDKRILLFALENNIEIIFASYIRQASDVQEVRDFLGPAGSKIMVCARIENRQGVINIDEIIKASDGILIDRGNLGNEIDESEVFLAQKSIMSKCNGAGKPVICSTHMLESMVTSCRPSSAECTDLANAILDGADCIMLDHETAIGDFPVEVVRKAANMCKQAEAAVWQKRMVIDLSNNKQPPIITIHAIAAATVEISFSLLASAIVIISSSLKSAQLLSQYRPKCPIIAVTRNVKQARQAHMFRGIMPLVYKEQRHIDWAKDLEERLYFGINFGRKRGFIRPGDPVVIMMGKKQGSGFTDKMRILYVTKYISHGTECICK